MAQAGEDGVPVVRRAGLSARVGGLAGLVVLAITGVVMFRSGFGFQDHVVAGIVAAAGGRAIALGTAWRSEIPFAPSPAPGTVLESARSAVKGTCLRLLVMAVVVVLLASLPLPLVELRELLVGLSVGALAMASASALVEATLIAVSERQRGGMLVTSLARNGPKPSFWSQLKCYFGIGDQIDETPPPYLRMAVERPQPPPGPVINPRLERR